jgi:hypothetical protein
LYIKLSVLCGLVVELTLLFIVDSKILHQIAPLPLLKSPAQEDPNRNSIKMPLWSIHHPGIAFANEETKRAFSADITKLYTSKLGLPAFYVIVQFIKMPDGGVWMGGEKTADRETPFIRVVIEHTAVNVPKEAEEESYKTTCQWVDEVMKPHVGDMGYDWEYHISENDRRLWKINGLIPPPWKSDAEREWVKANKALPWDGDH